MPHGGQASRKTREEAGAPGSLGASKRCCRPRQCAAEAAASASGAAAGHSGRTCSVRLTPSLRPELTKACPVQSEETVQSTLLATTGPTQLSAEQRARLRRARMPKWMWLDAQQVQEIRELAATELSQRKISRMTGVSRDTVRKILRGYEPNYEAALQRSVALEPPPFSGQPKRCGECGAMVQMPCLACFVRRHRSEA